MEIGEIIRDLRIKRGLTMKDLGSKVGVTEQAISQYERGKREPSDELLIKIFNILGFDIDSYIQRTIVPEPIWNYTLEYIKHVSEYLHENNKLNLGNLNYVTAKEVSDFIKDSSLFVQFLEKKHILEKEPNTPIAISVKVEDEVIIDLDEVEK